MQTGLNTNRFLNDLKVFTCAAHKLSVSRVSGRSLAGVSKRTVLRVFKNISLRFKIIMIYIVFQLSRIFLVFQDISKYFLAFQDILRYFLVF